MTSSTSVDSLTPEQVRASVTLWELDATRKIPVASLRALLPDVGTAVFFAKAHSLDFTHLSDLLYTLFGHIDVVAELMEGGHSTELQDYIVDTVPPDVVAGTDPNFDPSAPVPDSEILVDLFTHASVEVAQTIKDITAKLGATMGMFTSKQGNMVFRTLREFNTKRNSLVNHRAQIVHRATPPRLVIFDVSGSMSRGTVEAIADEVVALAYDVNASLAIVSNTTQLWDPGTFNVRTVLDNAEYGGTHYETLAPILNQEWDSVITIADYDSTWSAQDYLSRNCTGRIDTVYDISLVARPTYLAECVGILARTVKPLMVAQGNRSLLRW